MFPKVLNANEKPIDTIDRVNKKKQLKFKEKKFSKKNNTKNSSQLIESCKNENNDSTDNSDENEDYTSTPIQYDMPKPGPHAKSSDWRKWKLNQRAIRQEREEKRIIRQEKKEKEEIANALENQNLMNMKKAGRNMTVSIAIPGSVIGIVQSRELKTYVAGQIARAATLFCVDEIIVYNEYAMENKAQEENNQQLIKILEYLECPQYLRKTLFRPHKYLEHVGLLNALEAPHHFKINDEWEYREGVVTELPNKDDQGSWVDIGLLNKIQVDKKLTPGIRVTVKNQTKPGSSKLKGLIVSPETPRTQNGIYWGYQVRYAGSFRKVLYESSFHGDYDLKIAINNSKNANLNFSHLNDLPEARHVLIVFGGVNGIDAAIESDEKLKAGKMAEIFEYICESKEHGKITYGSRSIRLEEAILISLSILKPMFTEARNNNHSIKKELKNGFLRNVDHSCGNKSESESDETNQNSNVDDDEVVAEEDISS